MKINVHGQARSLQLPSLPAVRYFRYAFFVSVSERSTHSMPTLWRA